MYIVFMAFLYSLLFHSMRHVHQSLHRLNPDKIFEELQACPKEVSTLCLAAQRISLYLYDIAAPLRLSTSGRLLIEDGLILH